jgi:phosphoglycolate phosphatase
MSSCLPALIFDLDGTLTDSMPGILGCLRKVLDARNMGDYGPLERFIGPPVEEWAAELLPQGSEEDRIALARDYRACYGQEGWNNNSVFPGIHEMLADLRDRGFPLYVCTSKVEHFAIRILDLFELSQFFAGIYGDKAEYADHSKPLLLARLLAEQSLTSDSAYMIGDRRFDFEAARANDIPCIAAGWGYGSPEEFALADGIAATPGDIYSLVVPAGRTTAAEIASA